MMNSTRGFNNQIKQILILGLTLAMTYLVIRELYVFIPGFLGAVTVYILCRGSYFQLVFYRHWKRGVAAAFFLMIFCISLLLIAWITYSLLLRQIQPFLDDPANIINDAKIAIINMQGKSGITLLSASTMDAWQVKIVNTLPALLNDTMNILLNLALLIFVLYYILVHGKEIESYLRRSIPIKNESVHLLANETKRIVRVSAIGIPIISIVQGITATIGYYIFGLDEYIFWGFLTGVFAFFPIIGTMVVWIPLVLFSYMSGSTSSAIGLSVYSLIVTGNIDYIARITLLNKIGHIHPVVTVIGIIAGLGLFGFIGLIFGPLLVSYVILLFKIYTNEFVAHEKM